MHKNILQEYNHIDRCTRATRVVMISWYSVERVWLRRCGCVQVTVQILNQMVSKIREELPSLDASEDADQINKHFTNTLHHIATYRQLHSDTAVYDGIEMWSSQLTHRDIQTTAQRRRGLRRHWDVIKSTVLCQWCAMTFHDWLRHLHRAEWMGKARMTKICHWMVLKACHWCCDKLDCEALGRYSRNFLGKS